VPDRSTCPERGTAVLDGVSFSGRDFQTNIILTLTIEMSHVLWSYWPSVRAHKDGQTGGTSLFASVNFLYASGRFSSN